MKHCDVCRLVAPPIQRCGFGEYGVTLFLHPQCQQQLLTLSAATQDQIITRATGFNVHEIGRYFQ